MQVYEDTFCLPLLLHLGMGLDLVKTRKTRVTVRDINQYAIRTVDACIFTIINDRVKSESMMTYRETDRPSKVS